MKILMVAPQPFFEPRGTPFSVLGRLKALSKLGHEVDLVTYHIGEDVAIPGVVIRRIPSIPFIRKISIGPSVKKLFLDMFLLVKTMSLLMRRRYDLLHSHEEASFFCVFFAKVFRVEKNVVVEVEYQLCRIRIRANTGAVNEIIPLWLRFHKN